MNLTETLQLLDKLKAVGARHFKSNDLEVDLEFQPWVQLNTTNVVAEKASTINMVPPEPPPPPAYSAANTQKVQDLIDLLKAKDEELVNKIFPEGA